MIAVESFHRTYECPFCGQVTDHLVDFIEYCPDTHVVTINIYCTDCLEEAHRLGLQCKYLCAKLKATEWLKIIPSHLKAKPS